jgi:uncharacterized protein (TIGR03435 family)
MHVLTQRNALKLVTFVLVLVTTTQLHAQAFEVASIKRNTSGDRRIGLEYLPGGRYKATNLPLFLVIADAYNLPRFNSPAERLSGGPEWLRSEQYDIEATAEKGAIPAGSSRKVREDTVRLMVRKLLAERFQLAIRSETKELPVYAMVVAKGGPKLQKAKTQEEDCPETPANFEVACHAFSGGQGQGLHGNAVDMSDLTLGLSGFSDRPVIDKTGLSGLYNIQTEGWVPLRPRPPRPPGTEPTAEDQAFADPARPTIFAVLERLGLKLESQRALVETFVIEHAERPTEN